MAKNGGGKGGGGGGGSDGPLTLDGSRRADTLTGGAFGDTIWGRDGDDILKGMGGDDFIHGGNGNDIVIGDSGTVDNPTAEDLLTDGNDRLFGGDGNDALYGGGGDDELQGGQGLDILDGGSGYDIALYSADSQRISVVVTTTGFDVNFLNADGSIAYTEVALNIEGIVGTYYDDVMVGADTRAYTSTPDDFVNTFEGYYGNDTLTGGSGRDCISGGGDDDNIYGLAGNDVLLGGSGDDMITPGTGSDYVDGGANSEWDPADHDIVSYDGEGPDGLTLTSRVVDLVDDSNSPVVVGQAYAYDVMINSDIDFLWNVEEVRGTTYSDTMTGGTGPDSGDDHFVGGAGADTLDGGGGNDTTSYVGSNAAVDVDLSNSGPQSGGHAEGDLLSGFENLIGSDHDDTLSGDDNANVLTGGSGADTFVFDTVFEGGDAITDFSGSGMDGDKIDLAALGLDDLTFEFIALLNDNELWVDVDGGGTVDGTGDDVLIATFTDGAINFSIDTDVLI